MNEEQTKRVSDAADAVLNAADALNDARESLSDKRYQSELERERTQAVQQTANRIESAARRIDDALRKATIAAATLQRDGAYKARQKAVATLREGRTAGRSAPDQDGGIAQKRERAETALTQLETALAAAASLVYRE